MSHAVGSQRDLAGDRSAAGLWCGRLWDGRPGWAITAVGRDPHLTAAGKYTFRAFRHRSFRWPHQRDQLLEGLLDAAPDADVYVAPLLRDRPGRSQTNSRALEGSYAWLDADDWDEDRQAELLSTGVQVWSVASGGHSGSRHLYVDLGELLPGAEVTRYSRRLARAFGTDTHGGDNKLLRLPGTFNQKPRSAGGQPVPVRWLP